MSRGRLFAAFLVAALALCACARPPSPEAAHSAAIALAQAQGWQEVRLYTQSFELAAWVPTRFARDAALTIYIEGDGLAWISRETVSDDPTPRNPLALQLALAQPEGNAAYLARPCQYIGAVRSGCDARYWTDARFSPDVVAASDEAVAALKERFGAQKLTLVGYSGGAAVAALVAARRSDVVSLVTVAGNLDHRAWTQLHRISPLSASLNPLDERAALAEIPQVHFLGGRDEIVPATLVEGFVAGMHDARVVRLPDYDHQCCWVANWPRLWREI